MGSVKIPKIHSSVKTAISGMVGAASPDLDEQESELITTKLQLPSPHLSPTQIDMYLRCPLQYYHRYVLGRKSPPAVALVEGSAHHEALRHNNEYKRSRGRDLSVKTLVEKFADHFSDRSKEIEDWEGDSADKVIDRGRAMVSSYVEKFAPRLRPDAVEQEVRLKVGPVEVMGFVDVEGTVKGVVTPGDRRSVVDYKTVSRKKSEDELASSLQLTFYGMAMAQQADQTDLDVGFCNILKKGDIAWQPTKMNRARIKWFRQVVLRVADSISRGSFPPTDPASWACSEKFCGYWSQCRGKHA